ncbi:MAG: type II toxin-antitoxin system VapC family toxin [Propioniciclava sp.]|uniref:type II toxin-antitoxin system VapC family toxin n=1 Tax=Propioniciclava sp. TaxID=2038686 RepID=UPI0039E6E3BE
MRDSFATFTEALIVAEARQGREAASDLAACRGEPLLFKGNDFAATDVPQA